jgi:hypothetical protein
VKADRAQRGVDERVRAARAEAYRALPDREKPPEREREAGENLNLARNLPQLRCPECGRPWLANGVPASLRGRGRG